MRCKLDENLPSDAADLLSEAGHDAISVLAQGLGGDRDTVIAAACAAENRILITADTDFADIRAYPPRESPGIVVLRLRSQRKDWVLRAVRQLSRVLENESPRQRLWIVEEDRIRVRES